MRAATIVVMGVSGAGKTTVGVALAHRLGRPFLDADDLHPSANVAKLRAGIPLTDEDRAPWLDAVALWIDRNPPAVVACSALRRAYRDRLRTARTPLWFAHLDPAAGAVTVRLEHRRGHFLNPALLPDQFRTLEPLQPDECGVRVPAEGDVDLIVTDLCAAFAGLRVT